MHFDLADLRLLSAIAATGSLSKAAASVPVAVSAASTRLRLFEQRCGLSLFTRRADGMQPTPAGRLVLERSRSVLGEAEKLSATLRELARYRPASLEGMHLIYGVGEAKLREHGGRFLEVILAHRQSRGLTLDIPRPDSRPERTPRLKPERKAADRSPLNALALRLFAEGALVEDVMHQTQRSRSWAVDRLADHIRETRPASIATWVPNE